MNNAQGDRYLTNPRFGPGFRVTLDPSVELCPDGRHLLAGSPTRNVPLGADEAQDILTLSTTGSLEVTASNQQMIGRLLALDVLQPLPAGGVSRMDAVTVVIPVRDQPHHVEALLGPEDAFSGVVAVIVVDDGSDDPQALLKIANAASVQVDVVRCDVSRGPAGARNLGASRATTDLVVFVDADCRPQADWLKPLLVHFDDQAVAMVAPRIRAVKPTDEGATTDGGRRAFFQQLLAYELERGPLDLGDGPSAVGPRQPRNHVPSAALVVRRSAFNAVGGFDPSLRFGEDTDLVWRLADQGWVVRYEPSSVVQHEIRTSLGAVVRQRFQYGLGAVGVAERYPGRFTLLSIEPANLTALALTGAGLPLPAACLTVASTVLPALKWNDLGVPLERAARRRLKDQLGEAARLAWMLRQGLWPLALVLSLFSRRFRRLFLLAVLAPPVIDWKRRRGRLSLLGWLTFSLIDALASGAGVWTGCIRKRSFRVLSRAGSAGRRDAGERVTEPRRSIVRATNDQVLIALKPVPDHLVFIERLPIEAAVYFEPCFSQPVQIIAPIETHMVELAEQLGPQLWIDDRGIFKCLSIGLKRHHKDGDATRSEDSPKLPHGGSVVRHVLKDVVADESVELGSSKRQRANVGMHI